MRGGASLPIRLSPMSDARREQQPSGSASTRLRVLLLALVALCVLSVVLVSSRLDASTRLKALQTPHQVLQETVRGSRAPEAVAGHDSNRSEHDDARELPVATPGGPTDEAERDADVAIPRIIHQSWTNVYRVPTRFHPWMKSWRDLHPAWTYVFWTDEDNLRLFQELYPQYLHVAKAVKKVSLADMARYALLHHVGGLYVDADFECLQPFDDLHRDHKLFLSSEPLVHAVLLERSTSAALCNALMASAPGHPFWLRVLDNIKAKFDREHLRSDAVELTGPRMVKHTYATSTSAASDVVVLPSEFFYPEVAYWNLEPMERACRQRRDADAVSACEWLRKFPQGEFTPHSHATHHWQCTWCRDAHLVEFGPLRDVFDSPPLRPNISSTGVHFFPLK
ncbi:unnamed protein product [Phytophthora fragariaefolia]|uniref:Unnamed protein product n=1 Tax=Phytophthora fragariaefolia TaxID=1490495 RepID=A0A9W7D1W0_9STRA|nr:unnamed protein product [Phytophthora fragariaefolia]